MMRVMFATLHKQNAIVIKNQTVANCFYGRWNHLTPENGRQHYIRAFVFALKLDRKVL